MNTARHDLVYAVVFAALFLFQPAAFAQSEITVEGTVTDTGQEPLPGVNVVVRSCLVTTGLDGPSCEWRPTGPLLR
jgi:hypothetical protein